MPIERTRKVSQQDIARDLGVSQALVSMALGGQSEGVHPETFRRIRARAASLGYRSRGGANGSGLTQVGFVLRPGHTLYSQSSVFSHIQHGLHSFLEKEGISTLFLGTVTGIRENHFRSLARHRHTLLGAVVMGEVDPEFVHQLKTHFSRLVTVAASCPGYCHTVRNNEAQTMELLVEHLTGLGHRSFAWIGGNIGSRTLDRRWEALQQALHRRGLECTGECIELFGNPKQREGQEAARRLLDRFGKNPPTAWITYNGRMARGAVNHLLARQIEVPGAISVAACDGTYICEDEEPTLTGAYADPEKIGAVAGRLLLESTGKEDEAYNEVTLPAILQVRDSSGPPPDRAE